MHRPQNFPPFPSTDAQPYQKLGAKHKLLQTSKKFFDKCPLFPFSPMKKCPICFSFYFCLKNNRNHYCSSLHIKTTYAAIFPLFSYFPLHLISLSFHHIFAWLSFFPILQTQAPKNLKAKEKIHGKNCTFFYNNILCSFLLITLYIPTAPQKKYTLLQKATISQFFSVGIFLYWEECRPAPLYLHQTIEKMLADNFITNLCLLMIFVVSFVVVLVSFFPAAKLALC